MPFEEKFHLRIPGPTPVPPRVQHAMNRPMIGHRSAECSRLVRQCSQRLQPVFGTRENVLIITGSGTSALEAAVSNTVAPGEEVVVAVTGAFGDRFAKIAGRFGAQVHRLDIPWGEACSPDALKSFLASRPRVKAVFLTHCETSTGVLNPVQDLATIVKEHTDALVIVDGVSSVGGVACEMDAWGIDIFVTGSQKALMLPPGLAFVAVSPRAWEVIRQTEGPRFYLDLQTYHEDLERETTPFTPGIAHLFGLEAVLDMIEEEGLENIFARHRLMMEMTRAGVRALGLPLLTEDAVASPTVTAVRGTENIDASALQKELRRIGAVVASGQQHLKGKIFRIGHMGYCDPLDVLTLLSALETALHRLGGTVRWGAAVGAAEEVWNRV
jgi:aspartate aminotransferase-like enzyme